MKYTKSMLIHDEIPWDETLHAATAPKFLFKCLFMAFFKSLSVSFCERMAIDFSGLLTNSQTDTNNFQGIVFPISWQSHAFNVPIRFA